MSANVVIKSGTNQFHGSALRVLLQRTHEIAAVLPSCGPEQAEGAARISSAARSAGRSSATSCSSSAATKAANDRQNAQRFGTVPTAAMRRGDFSASPTPIYDPLTGAANGSGRTRVPGKHHSAEPPRPDRPEADRDLPLPNVSGSLADNYFATGQFDVRPAQDRREGERQRHATS